MSHGSPPRDGSADRRIEPQRPAASLTSVPDGDDPLSIDKSLAFGLGALGLGCSACCGALAFLRSAIRSHWEEMVLAEINSAMTGRRHALNSIKSGLPIR